MAQNICRKNASAKKCTVLRETSCNICHWSNSLAILSFNISNRGRKKQSIKTIGWFFEAWDDHSNTKLTIAGNDFGSQQRVSKQLLGRDLPTYTALSVTTAAEALDACSISRWSHGRAKHTTDLSRKVTHLAITFMKKIACSRSLKDCVCSTRLAWGCWWCVEEVFVQLKHSICHKHIAFKAAWRLQ